MSRHVSGFGTADRGQGSDFQHMFSKSLFSIIHCCSYCILIELRNQEELILSTKSYSSQGKSIEQHWKKLPLRTFVCSREALPCSAIISGCSDSSIFIHGDSHLEWCFTRTLSVVNRLNKRNINVEWHCGVECLLVG